MKMWHLHPEMIWGHTSILYYRLWWCDKINIMAINVYFWPSKKIHFVFAGFHQLFPTDNRLFVKFLISMLFLCLSSFFRVSKIASLCGHLPCSCKSKTGEGLIILKRPQYENIERVLMMFTPYVSRVMISGHQH